MKRFLPLTFILPLATAMTLSAAADEGEILKAHFKAVGGLEKLSEIKTMKRSGSAELGGMMGEMEGTTEVAVVVGKKTYSNMDLGMVSEKSGWNGEVGWKSNAQTGLTTLEGSDLETTKSTIYLDPLQSIYESYGASAFKQTDDQTIREKECVVLAVEEANLSFFLDKESHQLVSMQMQIEDPAMGPMAVNLYFSDYKEYFGIMIPDTTEFDVMDGSITMKMTYDKTEIDVEIDESIFEMPE